MISNAVPLADVLPWQDTSLGGRTVLICDSANTDGRFLLHTLACQTLQQRSSASSSANMTGGRAGGGGGGHGGRVLWLGCTPATDRQICSALKKIGCDVSITTAALQQPYPPPNTSTTGGSKKRKRLEIVSIMLEVAEAAFSDDDKDRNDSSSSSGHNTYLKKLYKRIKSWRQQQQHEKDTASTASDHNLIVIDDVSTLATIFGQRAAEMFTRQVRSLVRTSSTSISSNSNSISCTLAILCSHDADQEHHLTHAASTAAVTSVTGGGKKDAYIGAAGDMSFEQDIAAVQNSSPPWERSLVELADGIIDVVPLQSGFSLEAHGRLVFTERRGGLGWQGRHSGSAGAASRARSAAGTPAAVGSRGSAGGSSSSSFLTTVVNYCCEESSVKAFRLRAAAS